MFRVINIDAHVIKMVNIMMVIVQTQERMLITLCIMNKMETLELNSLKGVMMI